LSDQLIKRPEIFLSILPRRPALSIGLAAWRSLNRLDLGSGTRKPENFRLQDHEIAQRN